MHTAVSFFNLNKLFKIKVTLKFDKAAEDVLVPVKYLLIMDKVSEQGTRDLFRGQLSQFFTHIKAFPITF